MELTCEQEPAAHLRWCRSKGITRAFCATAHSLDEGVSLMDSTSAILALTSTSKLLGCGAVPTHSRTRTPVPPALLAAREPSALWRPLPEAAQPHGQTGNARSPAPHQTAPASVCNAADRRQQRNTCKRCWHSWQATNTLTRAEGKHTIAFTRKTMPGS